MLLLTGATGPVGSALLRRLTAARVPVRCLVRDPKRLGAERVRVQLALGDLADPPSFRNALRGVTTVVHLAASQRDQAAGSLEELNGIATWRMVAAAERAGVEHFVFLSALGASAHSRSRFLRSKALAERAVATSPIRHTILAPSIVYTPQGGWASLLRHLSLLPVVPLSGSGRAQSQPIWADDVADCVLAALDRPAAEGSARIELAGPDTYSSAGLTAALLRAGGRPRPTVALPTFLSSRVLKGLEGVLRGAAPVTWDEAELLEVPMVSRHGTAGAESLGVTPRRLVAVLGA